MKKVIFTIAITLGLAFGAAAQSDGFFGNWESMDDNRGNTEMPGLPTTHGTNDNCDAPLGGGLLILTALGVGYAFKRRVES